eukprot:gene6971-7185_t
MPAAGEWTIVALLLVVHKEDVGFSINQLAGWYSYGAINFAVFASVTGLLLSSLLLLGPMYHDVLDKKLPGLIDIILSGLWSIFFLAFGAGLASYGSCSSWRSAYNTSRYNWYPYLYTLGNRKLLLTVPTPAFSVPSAVHRQLLAVDSYCGTWNAVIAFGFLGFAAYAASAVFAGLDLKNSKGIVIRHRQVSKPAGDVVASAPAAPELQVEKPKIPAAPHPDSEMGAAN